MDINNEKIKDMIEDAVDSGREKLEQVADKVFGDDTAISNAVTELGKKVDSSIGDALENKDGAVDSLKETVEKVKDVAEGFLQNK